jgi:hypothetical protein
MDHAGKHEESRNSSQEIKSDSETLSKTLDEIDLSSNVFLDFENFSKFYEVCGTCRFFFFMCLVNFILYLSYLKKQFSGQIKETVSSSTKLPIKPDEIEYYMTCPSFKSFLQTQNDRILKL